MGRAGGTEGEERGRRERRKAKDGKEKVKGRKEEGRRER